MNFVTFLASIGLGGIQNIGSICSIVTAILGTQFTRCSRASHVLTTSSSIVAQHILFITHATDAPAPEYNHEIVALPHAVYKGSDPYPFNSTSSLPRFAPAPKRTASDNSAPQNTPYGRLSALAVNSTTGGGLHRSVNSLDGSILRSCVGREALKYRVDGDVNMFQSKTSLSLPAGEEGRRPISLDVKRLSQQRRSLTSGNSGGEKSRPTTAESSDTGP